MASGGARPGAGRPKKPDGEGRTKRPYRPESKSKAIARIHEEIKAGPPPPPNPEPDDVEPGEDELVEGVRTRDLSPDAVMQSNMAWWHRMGLKLRRQAHGVLSKSADGKPTEDDMALFSELMKEAERCMVMAGASAKELAPYRHARLAATVPLPPPGEEEEAKANNPIGPGADHLQTVLGRFAPHAPSLKVHQGGKS
jgi:hypothetical protein